MANTIADLAVCDTTKTCKTTTSCCGLVNSAASSGKVSTVKVCIPVKTLINGPLTLATGITGITYDSAKAGVVYAAAACAAKAAGASTLAVSAAAAATAVYMM